MVVVVMKKVQVKLAHFKFSKRKISEKVEMNNIQIPETLNLKINTLKIS